MVLTNHHDKAIEQFYTQDATMQENQETPRQGRDNLVEREKAVLARASKVESEIRGPVFQNGNHVVIRWRFRFEWPDQTITEMEELAYQRWDGEQIAEEQFFYDPAQRVTTRPMPHRLLDRLPGHDETPESSRPL